MRRGEETLTTMEKTKDATPTDPGDEPKELITELAFGSDGFLYVNAEHLSAEERDGRRMFQGYAMTPDEAQRAASAMHTLAFNVIVSAMPKARPSSRSPRSTRSPAKRSHPKR